MTTRRILISLFAACCLVTFGTVAAVADPDDGSAHEGDAVPLSWLDAPVLGIGSSGHEVAAWQAAMNTWLEATSPDSTFRLDVDGTYGRLSDSITRRFQFAQGLPVDGLVGPATRAAYLSAPALVERGTSPVTHEPALAMGDHGDAVAAWQSALNRWIEAAGAWLDPLVVDGIYGPATTSATEAFQRAQGVTVDGITGPETWAALISAPALVNVSPTTPPSGNGSTEQPAAGICSSSNAPIAELVLGAAAPMPRCLSIPGEHWLRIVNDGGATHVALGTWELDLEAGTTVTSPLPVGAYVDPGTRGLAVSRYGGSGPDLVVR